MSEKIMQRLKRSHEFFSCNDALPLAEDESVVQLKVRAKVLAEYAPVQDRAQREKIKQLAQKQAQQAQKQNQSQSVNNGGSSSTGTGIGTGTGASSESVIAKVVAGDAASNTVFSSAAAGTGAAAGAGGGADTYSAQVGLRQRLMNSANTGKTHRGDIPPPEYHAPWKLMRVIAGHTGWVRSICVDVSNTFFVTGGADSRIKVWDLASGQLKLTLTGHISAVRGVALSDRHPYLYSVGEDKMVCCWDLETNQVVRKFHGHLSGVFAVGVHPTLDIIATGGADSAVRVWDARSRAQIHVLSGHTDAIASLITQAAEPQLISGSHDSTVRIWDLAAGKSRVILTNHKKSVRALAFHPTEYSFVSASPDAIKKWKCPEGIFMSNFTGHRGVTNTVTVMRSNVLFAGNDNGLMRFYDWRTGHCFQELQTLVQPGSLDCEAGVFASCMDRSGSRLLTGEADKTIKIWREIEDATPETHPNLPWDPEARNQEKF